MIILFCEYRVLEPHGDEFRAWAARQTHLWQGAELLEHADGSGVFVEIWKVAGETEAEAKQKERQGGRSEWRQLDAWIKDGRDGLRFWTFRPFTPGG